MAERRHQSRWMMAMSLFYHLTIEATSFCNVVTQKPSNLKTRFIQTQHITYEYHNNNDKMQWIEWQLWLQFRLISHWTRERRTESGGGKARSYFTYAFQTVPRSMRHIPHIVHRHWLTQLEAFYSTKFLFRCHSTLHAFPSQ